MRISKYPCIAGVGFDFHLAVATPPATPPLPPALPAYPWLAVISNPASALIYGKFTSQVSSEALFDILFGHDWGIIQPHFAIPPFTGTAVTVRKSF